MEQALEVKDVILSDIESLRCNAAWRWITEEWEEILEELQLTLVVEDYPLVYRTQGRVSVLAELLTTIDKLEELVREVKSGN
jgi:hypothetical protein